MKSLSRLRILILAFSLKHRKLHLLYVICFPSSRRNSLIFLSSLFVYGFNWFVSCPTFKSGVLSGRSSPLLLSHQNGMLRRACLGNGLCFTSITFTGIWWRLRGLRAHQALTRRRIGIHSIWGSSRNRFPKLKVKGQDRWISPKQGLRPPIIQAIPGITSTSLLHSLEKAFSGTKLTSLSLYLIKIGVFIATTNYSNWKKELTD